MRISPISLALTRIGMGGPLQGAAMLQDFTSGNDTLDSRITFSRASNATVVGKDGTIQYAPHNLLTYSEQFDNSDWVKARSTVSANVVLSPNGTTTADKLTQNTGQTAWGNAYKVVTWQAGTYTLSVYAKKAEKIFIALSEATTGAGTVASTWFNLNTGVVGTKAAAHTAAITALADGWYRCSITFATTNASTYNALYYLADTDGSSTVTDSGGIYLWGAQLNVGSLQPYYPTTVKNLLGYTQEFDNAAWTKSNSFIQTNQIRNNTMQGAMAGTPGTLPTNWTGPSAPTGLARDIVATGVEDGIAYIDVRYYGTTTGAGSANVVPDDAISAAAGQSWTSSVYLKLAGGSVNNLTLVHRIRQAASGGSFNGATDQTVTPISGSLKTNRYAVTLASAAVGTLTIGQYLILSWSASGLAIDITLRIGMPQLVQGASAGDVVATYGTAKAVMYQAPDGTLSADKLVEDKATSGHVVLEGYSFSSATYTYSIYAKSGERTKTRLIAATGSGGVFVNADLSAGTVDAGAAFGTGFSVISSSILSLGNGWYRIALRFSATAGSGSVQSALLDASGNNSYTGDGTSGIYVWGAQLSDSASLDPYVYNPGAAPAAAAYYGPRFDYDPVTLQPNGLLIEEQRTNLLKYGSLIDTTTYSGSWGKGTNTTRVSTNIVAPDGTATAVSYSGNGSASFEFVSQPVSLAENTTYTLSVYAKLVSGSVPTSGTILSSQYNNGTTTTRTTVNFSGKLTSQWQRFTTTFTNVNAGTFTQLFLTDQTNTAEIAIWGAQLEAGSFPTSYIPTTSAQVTRASEIPAMIGTNFSSWYNQSEGTFMVDADCITADPTGYYRVFSANNGVSWAEEITILCNASSNKLYATVTTGGVSQFDSGWASGNVTISANTPMRLALGYKANDFGASANGGSAAQDSVGSLPTAVQLRLGNLTGGDQLNGHIRRLAYWNRRLSNAELQGVTA